MKNKLRIIGLTILVVSTMFMVGCKKEEPQIETNSPIEEEVQTIEAFGVVKAKRIENINIDFEASIREIPVQDGQQVDEDQVLVVLDMEDFNTRIKMKEHELKIQKFQLERLKDNIYTNVEEDPTLKMLKNKLNLAEETYTKAKNDYSDQKTLFEEGAISKSDLDGSEAILKNKKKEMDNALLDLEKNTQEKKSQLDELKIQEEKIQILVKEVASLESKLNKSYLDGNSIISTLSNGLVYDIGYSVGDSLSTDKKLLSIMDLDSLIIEAEIPEEFIRDVKLGSVARITPLADNSKEYEGTITHIASRAIQKNGETIIPIEITIENIDELLKPNYNVDVSIPLAF